MWPPQKREHQTPWKARCYAFRARPSSAPLCAQLNVFWRSSVRGPGPPAANCSRSSDRRRRASGVCLADDSTVVSLWQHADPLALRVARPGARTRCGPPIVNCSAGVCGKPAPHVGTANGALAPIPVLDVDLADISLNHNSERRTSKPRLGTTRDIFRRPRRPLASRLRCRDLSLIGVSKPGRAGRSNRVLGRF